MGKLLVNSKDHILETKWAKTRAVLAELGIPPENAAVTLNAAKEALLKLMPDRKGSAMSQAQLFTCPGTALDPIRFLLQNPS